MAGKTSMDKMAAQLEDIAKDITGTTTTKKSYAWDRIDNAVTVIADAVGAEVPDKKYVTKKERVADVINAIAEADVGSNSGPVLEWTQLVGPEDVFTYDSEHDNLAITIDDKFGWTETSDLIADAEKWMFAKWTYNGETKYSYKRSLMEEVAEKGDGYYNVEWLTTLSPDTSFSAVGLVAFETAWVIDTLDVYIRGLSSDVTSGISIYVAEVTDWNE